ncbi:MAG: hypothetical protein HGB10_03200 [Coriobacteriia bacterium]|nr:hypothetical protein [Coriobacteriia bacterium]
MDTTTVLLSVLLVVAAIACAVAIWALVEMAKTARSVKRLTDDLDARVIPLVDKLDVSVDAFNAELLRVDAIVTRFEEVSERVESTSRTVHDVANAPVEIVTDLADRVRKAWRTRKSAHTDVDTTGQTPPEADAATASPADAPTPTSEQTDTILVSFDDEDPIPTGTDA